MGLGMPAELASKITSLYQSGNGVQDNNVWLKWRNAANSANTNILKSDNSDDTLLNATSLLRLQVAGTTELILGDNFLRYTGALFETVANSADAADSQRYSICGGGSCSSSRGSQVQVNGNDSAVNGDINLTTGAEGTSDVKVNLFASGSAFSVQNSSNIAQWDIVENTGKLRNLASGGGGDVSLSATGTTVAIQEGTAASACSGTATATGAAAVTISTTCVTTASRIFISRTSTIAVAVVQPGCWTDTIVNGVSFNLDCTDAAENSTFNWIIFHEA
jgi:hypothetical protein